jgi:hypothetical protein
MQLKTVGKITHTLSTGKEKFYGVLLKHVIENSKEIFLWNQNPKKT